MTDKTEATRLADALASITYFNGKCEERDAAVQMLRRWPDAGEPVAWQAAILRGEEFGTAIVGWEPCTESQAKYLMRPTRPLYTAPPAERIAALEEAAKLCEQARPSGGRAWTAEQAACFDALTYCADAIRALAKEIT